MERKNCMPDDLDSSVISNIKLLLNTTKDFNSEQKQKFYDCFTKLSGIFPNDHCHHISTINSAIQKLAYVVAFYLWFGFFILITLFLLIAACAHYISWPMCLFLIVSSFLILYLASITFFIDAINAVNNILQPVIKDAADYQKQLEENLIYVPESLMLAIDTIVT